jgi:glycosyltransferase involved in cell wall biosynthesis
MRLTSKILLYLKRPRYFLSSLYFNVERKIHGSKFFQLRKKRLVIFDDIFPHPFSSFRFIEFNYYLNHIDDLHIYTTGDALNSIHESKSIKQIINEYISKNHKHAGKISQYNHHKMINAEMAYIVFAGNVLPRLDMLEKYSIPFVFTLYPGFGLRLDDSDSDRDLQRIFSSPMFRKVIISQKVVYDYLLKCRLCPEEKIKLIYGVVLPCSRYLESLVAKQFYPTHKESFDICFVANKQMERGVDKGYDIFIEAAHRLATLQSNLFFHIVGPYSGKDIDVKGLAGRLTFYGRLLTDDFPSFYSRMDIILSPNRSNILAKGAFDGFPTGACTEAGLNGVALLVSDDLNQNIKFTNGQDIVIIQHTVEDIVEKVAYFYQNTGELYQIAKKGQQKIIDIYSEEAQLGPRLNLLLNTIEENKLTSAI